MRKRSESMHSEAIPAPIQVERVGAVLDSLIGSKLTSRMTDTQRAAAAWYACNGDRERAHTTRVFLRKPKVEGADPVICVYVDSHSFLVDLNANRDIYLGRLANWGFYVSGIRFEVDRYAKQRRGQTRKKTASNGMDGATEVKLTAEQQAYVQDLVSDVPDSLKESISKAIAASLVAESGKAAQSEE